MKKFLTIIKAFWQRALTYRFTVIAYRIGEMGEIGVLILMWTAIYGTQEVIKGFTLPEMITYILAGNLFHVMVRNFLSTVVAGDIKEGQLSMFLIKPMSYFSYILAREIGRISLATILSVIWNFDSVYLLVIFIMLVLAFVTELLLSYLVGLIAFWTDELDGLYRTIE